MSGRPSNRTKLDFMLMRRGKRGADVGLSARRGQALLPVAFAVASQLLAAALAMARRATDACFIKLRLAICLAHWQAARSAQRVAAGFHVMDDCHALVEYEALALP